MDQKEARLWRTFLQLREPEFQPLVEHLKEKLGKAQRTLQTATDLQTVFRAQGEASALADLLDSVEKSAEILRRTRP